MKKKGFKEKRKSSHVPGEVKGLLALVTSAVIFLSLISFSDGHDSANWLGLFGYVTAWVLLYAFGLGSYLLILMMAWMGWQSMRGCEVEHFSLRIFSFTILLISTCVLLNLIAQTHPGAAKSLQSLVYSETMVIYGSIPHSEVRYNLGGVPFYYLYYDIPTLNLQHLLSNIGTSIVFGTLFVVSLLLLTRFSLAGAANSLAEQIKEKREAKAAAKETEGSDKPSKSTLPFFAKIKESLGGILSKKKESIPVPKKQLVVNIPVPPADEKPRFTPPPQPLAQPLPSTTSPLKTFTLPPLSLLTQSAQKVNQATLKQELHKQSEVLEATLASFGIQAKTGEIHCGPTITSFELQPAQGVKVQKIKALADDIALKMEAKSIRIIAPIPGKAAVGIEIPTPTPQEVSFKELLHHYQKGDQRLQIPLLLGKTVNGSYVFCDLTKMPHCIIAGATGSGKSVCINTMVMSILMNMRPDDVKLLLIDPKKVELTPYSEVPHMLSPVIVDPQDALIALKWLVREMEYRYEVLKQLGVRNIAGFHARKVNKRAEAELKIAIPETMPYLICIIDELADLMMIAGNDIEMPIARIAQMARAVGIHLILATQRPSREVITGLIKANFPTRIAFKVASRVNSQIILDEIGAESLLGNGDMLLLLPGTCALMRAQGAFIRDEEISRVIEHVCKQAPPQYLIGSFAKMAEEEEAQEAMGGGGGAGGGDALYQAAYNLVVETGNASTTFLQRKLKVGYARAASLMDQLHVNGVVSEQEGSKPRRVLVGDKRKGHDEDE